VELGGELINKQIQLTQRFVNDIHRFQGSIKGSRYHGGAQAVHNGA
jgi:hypothetical protein